MFRTSGPPSARELRTSPEFADFHETDTTSPPPAIPPGEVQRSETKEDKVGLGWPTASAPIPSTGTGETGSETAEGVERPALCPLHLFPEDGPCDCFPEAPAGSEGGVS